MRPAIIFDFDGTIADTLNEARLVLNELGLEYGFDSISEEEVPLLQGLSVDGLIKHLGIKRRHVPILLAKGTRMLRSHIDSISPCEGMPEVLPELRNRAEQFGILTSNSVENVELFLETHGLRDLFTFISSTSTLKGKAKHLKAIARTFSIHPDSMIYLGDEVRDIKAAQKANVPNIAVSWGFNSKEALLDQRPHFLAEKPADLLDAELLKTT